VCDIRTTDTSLRDGSHREGDQSTKDEVHAIVSALDEAGVPVIEVTHGNAPVEASIDVFDKTGIDFFDVADAAEEVVAPAMPQECLLDHNALIMGYSGVYSSFLKQRHPPVGALRGARPPAAAPRRVAQADRRPGRPTHRPCPRDEG
jgi:isopropylmalate/homocitrate/citramalate synthase